MDTYDAYKYYPGHPEQLTDEDVERIEKKNKRISESEEHEMQIADEWAKVFGL